MMDALSKPLPVTSEWRRPLKRILTAFGERMPKGLYARALIIIIAPIVLLESVVVVGSRRADRSRSSRCTTDKTDSAAFSSPSRSSGPMPNTRKSGWW